MKYLHVIKYSALAVTAGVIFVACASTDHESASYSTTEQEGYASDSSGRMSEASGADYSSDWQSSGQTSTHVVSTKSSSSSNQQYSQPSSSQASSTQRQYSSSSQASQAEGDQWIIPLHEERVSVGKRTVDSGQVTIRKVVTTETINQPIELRRETLVIDRQGGNSSVASGQSSGSTLNEPAGAQPGSSAQSGDSQPFQEQTYTIQLREEQPVVEKSVVQTGRVVARKNSEMNRQNISREVRREDVQLDRSGSAQNVQIRGDFQSSTGREASGAQRSSTSSSFQSQQGASTQTTIQSDTDVDVSGDEESLEDPNTLDEINRGNNTRGGAEDLTGFDEKAPKQ